MIRAVFFDVDGTLVSHANGRVPDSAREALAQLRARGILTFIATGRSQSELVDTAFLDGLTFDGYIGLNGQYCWKDERVIYEHPIDPRDVRTIYERAQQAPFPCSFVGEWGLVVNYIDDQVRKAQAAISSELPPVDDLSKYLDRPVYQIVVYRAHPYDQKAAKDLIDTRSSRWHDLGFDLLPNSGGKHAGARKLLELYGIAPEEALAIGDGDNDIDLFRYVGTSVAMGEALDEVKCAATYVTGSVNSDGIAQALRHYGLID